MSVRRGELARLQAAGWTVTVDSPWRRLGAALARLVGSRIDSDESTAPRGTAAGGVGGWSR
jgi:hypothetical protein